MPVTRPGRSTGSGDRRAFRGGTDVGAAGGHRSAAVADQQLGHPVGGQPGSSGSTPRSKRLDASEGSLCRRAVRKTDIASKWAASITTWVVLAESSVVAPPITPARPIGPESSVISRSSADSVRSTPSSVVSRSPARGPSYHDRAG